MKFDTAYIDDLLRFGERISFECKSAENEIPKSFWETYSSFANTYGGDILLGVNEDLKATDVSQRFLVVGVKKVAKIKKSIFDTLNSDKVNKNILTDNDVQEVDYNGVTLILVHVPQSDYRDRPIYLNGNMTKGTYKRNYEGDYHCTESEVKSMIRDANEEGNDSALIEHYTMDDIDLDTLHAYRNRFRTANQEHVWNDYDDKDFLLHMGGYAVNRITRREGLTMAGLLMFGKGLAVRERFSNLRMDYVDQTNLVGESRWSDRLTYDGRWENNLYNFFIRVLNKLTSDLKRPFMLEGVTRIDDTPVHKAIREALTNAIIHADYMVTGVLRVDKLDDGFMFSNPGTLKIPVTDIYSGGHSNARNPKMQAMFRMIGFGDNIGSGFPTILRAWQKENWSKPRLEERNDLQLVELKLSMTSLITEECYTSMHNLFGDKYMKLNKECQLVLATTWGEGNISNNRTQLLLGVNPIEAGKILHDLVEKQMIVSSNRGRWTTYSLQNSQGVEKSRSKKSQGVKKSRSSHKQDITEKILRFCKTPRTLQEIADHLSFSDKYRMKRVYIDPIMGTHLNMTETKNAPTQKYITLL